MTITPDASILEALQAIDRGAQEIALVCDDEGRVLGTLTDGDLRRAILGGATLESRAVRESMQLEFSWVGPDASRAEVLDLMRARGIKQVPVLDASRRILGLHLMHELLGATPRPNWAVIMAGGQGTRLRPLTENIPKPMIPVAGRPILERLILHLVGYGVTRIYLSINYLGHMIEDHFGDGGQLGCRIEYLREESRLGTGGALSLLPERPRDPLVVLNGDLVTQFDLARMLEFHADGGYCSTFGVRPYAVDVPYGVVESVDGRLLAIREKPTQRMLVNAGIYVLSPEVLELVPANREFPITELFEDCLSREMSVGVHLIEDEWLDVGRHHELRQARGEP
jgi:dTDP-glucose pyrophosphorylase